MKKTSLFWWIPVLIWAGLIFHLSGMTIPPREPLFPYEDKVAHLIEYGGLGFFCLLALRLDRHLSWFGAAVGAMVLTSLYGISDEWHQAYVPGREVDVRDWMADTAGGCLAFPLAKIGAWVASRNLREKTQTPHPRPPKYKP